MSPPFLEITPQHGSMALAARVRNRHFFASDLVLIALAAYCSFVLRLEDFALGSFVPGFFIFSVLAVLLTTIILRWAGIYATYWQYASIQELTLLFCCIVVATALTDVASLVITTLVDQVLIPRSIPFIFPPLALGAVTLPRLAVRARISLRRQPPVDSRSQTVLVMGAGEAGSMIVHELQRNPQLGMRVIGFIDDDKRKHLLRIHGVPVLGDRYSIASLVYDHHVNLIIIAMPVAAGKEIREIVRICELARVPTKIIPGIYELLDGTVKVSQLRDVQIEDLLRRKPVNTDIGAVRDLVRGRRVLVTGGGGSIGSEVCRQILQAEPAELIVMGHGENSVFEIQNQLLKLAARQRDAAFDSAPAVRIKAVIADIRFPERVRSVFMEHRPELVFHAAAHKHVPLMETNPVEAITNNVLGTRNLLRAALESNVEHFVMISTDKAVNPVSVMGVSKRLAELLVHQTAVMSGRPYVVVRFGNVLGSRGSVVLTFKQQIAAGGPITITHPDMRRFFMTIPEAVQLVLQAAVLGRGGEVFMLEMGEPVKILDLAHDIIALSGLEVSRDIDIAFTGLRPGEKLFEELFVPGEHYERTAHEKIFIATSAVNVVPHNLDQWIEALAVAAQRGDTAAIYWMLQKLVPEYRPHGQVEQAIEDQRPRGAVELTALEAGAA